MVWVREFAWVLHGGVVRGCHRTYDDKGKETLKKCRSSATAVGEVESAKKKKTPPFNEGVRVLGGRGECSRLERINVCTI